MYIDTNQFAISRIWYINWRIEIVVCFAAELLELLCDTLLAGDTAEIVSAARAIWALAANNHKV